MPTWCIDTTGADLDELVAQVLEVLKAKQA